MKINKILENLKKHKKVLIAIFLIAIFIYYLIWTISQPFNSCPDEEMKYDICKYLYQNNSLPRGDDVAIRNSIWGISYAFQPILTYMISAILMKIMAIFTQDQFALVIAARLVSTISMTGVIYLVIKISQKLFKGIYKYLFITFVAFLPLTAFLASYINNDSTALLTISIIIYTWILGLESNWKNKHCIMLGIGVGFCALTYYNAYGYILCSVILCLISVMSNKMKLKEILQKILIVSLIAFLIAGWWFIRNAIIYNGDILGLNAQIECGNKYAQEDFKPSKRKTPQSKNESIIDMLYKDGWVHFTMRSFVGIFGYHTIVMSSKIYYCYFLIWIIAFIGIIMKFKELFIYDKEHKNKYILNYIFVLSIIIPIILSIYYSFASDFQPQGRYIMPIIIPFAYFLVNGIEKIIKKFVKSPVLQKTIITILIALIIFISFKALFGYIIPAYKMK